MLEQLLHDIGGNVYKIEFDNAAPSFRFVKMLPIEREAGLAMKPVSRGKNIRIILRKISKAMDMLGGGCKPVNVPAINRPQF